MERPDERDEAERAREERIARARESIGRSFDELISRSGSQRPIATGARDPAAPPSGPPPPPAAPPSAPSPPAPDRTVAEAARAIEARLGAWVGSRVEAAERRLELQSKALEAALGEQAAGARRGADDVERDRAELNRRISEVEREARGQAEARSLLERRLGDAEELRKRMEARFAELDRGVPEQLEKAIARGVEEAEKRLELVNAEMLDRQRKTSEERLEILVSGEAAKAEARLGAESRRVAEGIEERAGELRGELEGAADSTDRSLRDSADRIAEEVVKRGERHAAEVMEVRLGEFSQRGEDRERAAISAVNYELRRTLTEVDRRVSEARRSLEGVASEGASAQAARAGEEAEARLRERLDAHLATITSELRERVDGHVTGGVEALERTTAERLAAVEGSLTADTRATVSGHMEELDKAAGARVESVAAAIRGHVRDDAGAAVAEAGRQAFAQASAAVSAAVAQYQEQARAHLEQVFQTNVERGVAEGAEILRTEFAAEAEQFRAEAAGLRGELGRRRIRKQREQVEAALEVRQAELLGTIREAGDGLKAELAMRAAESVEDGGDQLAAHAAAAEQDLWSTESELRLDVEEAAFAKLEERLDEEMDARSAQLERRVDELVAEAEGSAERRLAALAAVAEERLLAADRAQEREERVRDRLNAAEREAQQRVREAERRLIEVLGRLDAMGQRPD